MSKPLTNLDETRALLQLKKTEIRFHIAKLVILTAVSIMTAVGVYLAIRQDNNQTRHLVCQIAGQAGLHAQDCQ